MSEESLITFSDKYHEVLRITAEGEIIFNKKDILLTENLGKDLGISKTLSDVSGFLDKLGIKI